MRQGISKIDPIEQPIFFPWQDAPGGPAESEI